MLAVALFSLVVLAYVTFSRRLATWNISAPIVFMVVGTLLFWGHAPGLPEPTTIRLIAETTLALILFNDAAQVRPKEFLGERGLLGRLLLIGLPLTILVGWLAARAVFPDAGVWLALFLAAALAPTDAGLGAATVLNPVVPERIRRVLNGESGLNDGLATPVVLFAIAALAAGPEGNEGVGQAVTSALIEIAIGGALGAAVGVGAGRALALAARRGWLDSMLQPVAVVVIPVLAYFGATALHGNGFIAAFLAGTAFASTQAATAEHVLATTEALSGLLGYAVWALFGVLVVSHLGDYFSWPSLLFAVLALTVLRMVPVAVALLGSRLRAPTVLFIGWFGPRGLATVVFALIAIEDLGQPPASAPAVGAIALTVMLSIILHGVTASPWARAYGSWVTRERPVEEVAGPVGTA